MNTNTSLHTLVGPAKVQGEMVFLGQNILLPLADDSRPRFAAVIYAARSSDLDTPAVALLIKLAFTKPMMPLISPGHRLWEQLVKPHLQNLKNTLLKHEISGQASQLGAVSTEIASLVRYESRLLLEGGALMLPPPPLPQAAAAGSRMPQKRIELSSAEDEEAAAPSKKTTVWPVRLAYHRAA